MSTLYVTGTDTDVGKTVASVALMHALRAAGRVVVGMKPVASGCARTKDGWRNEDALALQAAGARPAAYDNVNPYALPVATAPQIAARAAGITVDLAVILAAHARLAAHTDVVVIEGVGGWMAPLADGLDQAAIVHALDCPVVLVVGMRLGCINHARLTLRAIRADGARCVGWIGNGVEGNFDPDGAYDALVGEALDVPCLGRLPHATVPDGRRMAAALTLPSDFAA